MKPKTPCKVWTGSTSGNGYGTKRVGPRKEGKMAYVHRAAWAKKHGPIPPGVKILHKCDNPPCWRLGHLFAGSQLTNMRDCARKGRTMRGERHVEAKLTESDVLLARALRSSGFLQREIAAVFGISRPTASYMLRGKTWAHI